MKKISNKKTVTIALSVYNEERNIIPFLNSLIIQNDKGFMITQILIISDGSTDKTVQRIQEVNDQRIKIINCKSRKGKSFHLNTIYRNLITDYLVQTDGDVIFSHSYVVRDMIKQFMEDENIGMCAGNPQPINGSNFIEKADSNAFKVYALIYKNINNGKNVFTADGRILAYKRDLLKKINIPEDMISNDVYTYYCCITLGYKFKYVKEAIVYFKCPLSLKDKVRQNKRAAATNRRMARYFPWKIILRESYIPTNVRIKSAILQFFKDPIGSIFIFGINKYCQMIAHNEETKLNAKWDIATSTKALRI